MWEDIVGFQQGGPAGAADLEYGGIFRQAFQPGEQVIAGIQRVLRLEMPAFSELLRIACLRAIRAGRIMMNVGPIGNQAGAALIQQPQAQVYIFRAMGGEKLIKATHLHKGFLPDHQAAVIQPDSGAGGRTLGGKHAAEMAQFLIGIIGRVAQGLEGKVVAAIGPGTNRSGLRSIFQLGCEETEAIRGQEHIAVQEKQQVALGLTGSRIESFGKAVEGAADKGHVLKFFSQFSCPVCGGFIDHDDFMPRRIGDMLLQDSQAIYQGCLIIV